MCGIAGVVSFNQPIQNERQIRAMTGALAHRGPDGDGIFKRDRVALGHRRLSIIDLDGGRQPMSNEDGAVWVTYNGEIYNFRDLRQELQAYGHVFASQCDTEVIVHAYEEWGVDCVKRFRGMFAFAVADFRQRKVMLARDHFGIKPLCVRFGKDYIAFASEIRALLLADEQSPSLDPQAIDYYLRYRYIPQPDTAYESIVKLPPAHFQMFDFDGHTCGPQRYWQLKFRPERGRSDDEWLEEFSAVFRESVQSHLVADVPFGAFLSGGVDSSLVAMEMGQILGTGVRAYTIGFDEENYSELPYAQQVANELGIDLRAEIVKPDIVTIFDELISHYGEPFADTSALPTWCVSQFARSEVPMILSGDGGDELFAGYHRYNSWMDATSSDLSLRDLKKLISRTRPALKRLFARLRGGVEYTLAQWFPFIGVSSEEVRLALWRPEYREIVRQPCPTFVEAARYASRFDRLANVQSLDVETYLPADILTKVDIAGMCHGLEVRTPFTDVRVAEFAARLPLPQRRRISGNNQAILKWLPKHRMSRRFSGDLVHRRKMGFGIPELEWLHTGSPVRDRLNDLVANPNARLFDLFERREVRRLIGEFDDNSQHSTLLWLMLILGVWIEQQKSVGIKSRAA